MADDGNPMHIFALTHNRVSMVRRTERYAEVNIAYFGDENNTLDTLFAIFYTNRYTNRRT